jgi:hypothetical protein
MRHATRPRRAEDKTIRAMWPNDAGLNGSAIDQCLANEESLAASDETTTRQLASHAGIRFIDS